MYRYDAIDQSIVDARAAEFREQAARRLAGELTEAEFKPLRLMNGLYLQLHAYMLRIAVPYGVLDAARLRVLARIARAYDRGYGHFTTRQNLQLNWIRLEDAPAILDELAQAGLHAIQTSGNCIRNITSDPWAGAAAGEADDPRVWAEALRQWSTLHPEFSYLPRKFKIAVTASDDDRAAVRVHDVGLSLKRGADGALGFEVIVGGGLGRTPYVGPVIKPFLPAEHLLSYLTAVLRVFNRHGRRDNLYKARIKVLVAALGAEAFAAEVEAEWTATDRTTVDAPAGELERIRASFPEPVFEDLPARCEAWEAQRAARPALARFARNNLAPHRRPGYAIVNVTLKTPGQVPGDATAEQMEALADLAERFSGDEIRVTHEQNLVLPHVRLADVAAVHDALQRIGLATPNLGQASDIIACPGLDYCALANARSINIAQDIALRFADPVRAEATGELKIKISGCINACGHHHVGHIGILGVEKKGEEVYQLTLGGSGASDARIGDALGPALPGEQVGAAVETLVDTYIAHRRDGERFNDTYARLGVTPFREAVYADADPA